MSQETEEFYLFLDIPQTGILKYICLFCLFIPYFFFFCFLGPYSRHMEVPRPGVKSELQLPAHTTATATQDPSRICDLRYSSQQRRILNALSKARGRTCNIMVPGWICFHCATTGTPLPYSSCKPLPHNGQVLFGRMGRFLDFKISYVDFFAHSKSTTCLSYFNWIFKRSRI